MSTHQNRIISIYDKKTCIRLHDIEWQAIDKLCQQENINHKQLFELIIEHKNNNLNMTSSVRLFSIVYYKSTHSNQFISNENNLLPPLYQAIKSII